MKDLLSKLSSAGNLDIDGLWDFDSFFFTLLLATNLGVVEIRLRLGLAIGDGFVEAGWSPPRPMEDR